MGFKKIYCLVLSLALWVGCFTAGLELSHRRPLWNDELYTHVNVIAKASYSEILAGRIFEGNNSPLFYLTQKAVCDILGYKLNRTWDGKWLMYDDYAQVILRLAPNVFMSTAITLLFFLIAYSYSLALGIFALAVMLALPATWFYWAEGRPYELWLLLTVIQVIFFLKTIDGYDRKSWAWIGLTVTHILLSFTLVLGAVQAVQASLTLWLFHKRRLPRYFGLAVVPVAIAFFYYERSPKFKFWFDEGPVQLILHNVPLEYWILLVIFAALLLFFKISPKMKNISKDRDACYFIFAIAMSMVAAALLMHLKWKAIPQGEGGFAVSYRYFLFLVPLSAIAVTLAVKNLWQWFKNDPLMRLNIGILVGGLLLLRAAKTYILILQSATFLHIIR